jgi:hypothetical protein
LAFFTYTFLATANILPHNTTNSALSISVTTIVFVVTSITFFDQNSCGNKEGEMIQLNMVAMVLIERKNKQKDWLIALIIYHYYFIILYLYLGYHNIILSYSCFGTLNSTFLVFT